MPESGESVFEANCTECNEKDDQIIKMENMLEKKDDKIAGLKDSIDDIKQELYGYQERDDREIRDLHGNIEEQLTEIKGLEERVKDLESIAADLDKILYNTTIALHIVDRFLPEAQRDLVDMSMLFELKCKFGVLVEESYDMLVDIGYSSRSAYPLPQFDEKEEV